MVKSRKRSKSKRRIRLYLQAFLFVLILSGGILGYNYYQNFFKANVVLQTEEEGYLLIPTGATFEQVVQRVRGSGFITDSESFKWVATRMEYPQNILPGRYKVEPGMNNYQIVSLLISGKQTPVQLTYQNFRKKEDFCGRVARRLEFDSLQLLNLLNDRNFLAEYKLTPDNAFCIFLPNTYQIYWNTTAQEFFERMYREYQKFWNTERSKLAAQISLSPEEVCILASIVDLETNRDDEMPAIAGVYMNRLKAGRRLEADPTVVFANDDFSIRRVRGRHTALESPYNTYRVKGLPPGPIYMPSLAAIDAVLRYQRHSYMYFCARDDFSGYHAFATTYPQHLINARKFQRALNKRSIL